MGVALPRYVALKSLSNNKYLCFINEDASNHGFLQFSGEEFLSLYTKFELEMSQTKYGLYNIRCCYTNKYLVPESAFSPFLKPGANEPNNDDHWASSLFEPIAVVPQDYGGKKPEDDSGEKNPEEDSGNKNPDEPIALIVQFRHFKSGEYASASIPEQTTEPEQQNLSLSLPNQTIDDETKTVPFLLCGRLEGTPTPENQKFLVIDLESFFILPKLVAFKAVGDTNGQYLGALTSEQHPHLKLVSEDVGDPAVVNEILPSWDGSVVIKCKSVNKIWRSGPGGIFADYDPVGGVDEEEGEDKSEIRYLPIKLGRNRVALQNAVTGKYCISYTAEGQNTKWLTDAVDDASSIVKDAIFEVHEPVFSRDIYDVEFNLLDARIYGKKVITLATHSGVNTLTEPKTLTFKLGYTLNTMSTWVNIVSFMASDIKTTLKSSVPSVVSEGEIKITSEFEGTYDWGKEIEVSSNKKDTTFTFTVAPKTKVGIKVLATQAICDVPFFYSRNDTLTNGEKVVYTLDDGVYTGISYYNIKYEFTENQL